MFETSVAPYICRCSSELPGERRAGVTSPRPWRNWLGVSEDDREFVGEDKQLPLLYPFAEVAKNEKITISQLKDFVEGNGLDYIQAGRNRYFTHTQRIRFEQLHRAKART